MTETYSISNPSHFNGVVPLLHQLQDEIINSSIASATIQYINRIEDQVDIIFDSTINTGDKTTLDGLVSSHVPNPEFGEMEMMAMGEIFYEGATLATTTTINLTEDIASELNPVTTLITTHDFDSPSNGRLRFTGSGTRTFHCAFSLSFLSTSANQLYVFEIRKNDVLVTGSRFQLMFKNANDFQSVSYHKVVSLTTNDYISLYATNLTSGADIEIYNLNIVAIGDGM